ncbi:MAG: hypothetical protein A2Y25_02305 [Candidatus Melainabacteria bacterium GWF2_37_15]|nr:MAG: hypothetical protein A2Y25_02305 [Candidatus Melainabacteria bacterium GWF2_37_15]
MIGKVLLPLDGSEASLKAFIPAKSIAELLGLNLCILYVSDEVLTQEELIKKLNIKTAELDSFMISQRSGVPETVIIEEGEKSDYIIMGTHGKTADETRRMGSTTAGVIEGTFKPIFLIKPDSYMNIINGKWVPHRALIPLNGAPGSAQALAPAVEILRKTTAKIELLHICQSKAEPIKEEGGFTAPYYEDYPQHEWASWSKEFIRRFSPVMENHNHINMSVSMAQGDPGDEIVTFAEKNNNDFIAIAWHGTMSQFRAMTLKKVLAESKCPIMLIKIKD